MNVHEVENKIREKLEAVVEGIPPYLCKANRKQLPFLFNDLGYTKGAEVGVFRGQHALFLCQMMPNLKLILVDPWLLSNEGKRIADAYEQCVERMEPYNVEIMRMTSEEASKIVPDGSLDFVYIDADHYYEPVMNDIVMWEPKVRVGGIVSGHDYVDNKRSWVATAVDEYISLHNIDSYYITADKSSVDKNPSWLWVKK